MKFKYIKTTTAALICAASFLGSVANAGIISDYLKTDSIQDNWQIVFQGGYNDSFNYADILNSVAAGSQVALATSVNTNYLSFDLFAGTGLSIVQTITARDQTIFSDDAYWYRNGSSVGFSKEAKIQQSSADIWGLLNPLYGLGDASADFDISWHGGATTVNGGWRSGLHNQNEGTLNGSWQRYVLVRAPGLGDASQVPEPSTLAIFALGMIGLASRRFKK